MLVIHGLGIVRDERRTGQGRKTGEQREEKKKTAHESFLLPVPAA